MTLKHHPADFVHVGFHGAGQRRIVHHLADAAGAKGAAVAGQGFDDFAESQHADQVAIFHHHQRADVALGHGVDCEQQGGVRRHGVERIALDLQDVADFHVGLRCLVLSCAELRRTHRGGDAGHFVFCLGMCGQRCPCDRS
ncbi:hypothetical protein D9M72_413520 [compost metagenome]